MADYGDPWHRVREMKDDGPDDEPAHVAVDHDPCETDPDNGTLVLESADDARLARTVACVNLLAGVPDDVLAGKGIDGTLLGLLRAVLRDRRTGTCEVPSPNGSSNWRLIGRRPTPTRR
jgi:hypothetical protein